MFRKNFNWILKRISIIFCLISLFSFASNADVIVIENNPSSQEVPVEIVSGEEDATTGAASEVDTSEPEEEISPESLPFVEDMNPEGQISTSEEEILADDLTLDREMEAETKQMEEELYEEYVLDGEMGIILDGFVFDWYDKPVIYDGYEWNVRLSDNLYSTAWHTDQDNFYIKIERYGYKNLGSNWRPVVELYYSDKIFELRFKYNPNTGRVSEKLYDVTNGSQLIWSDNGLWGGRFFYRGFLFEGYVPLEEIVGNTVGGYELKAVVFSGNDRCPDSGDITVASLPTLSIFLEVLLGLFGLGIIIKKYFIKRKNA